jgi:hypothetical protein
MLRKIITSTEPSLTIQFPQNMVGKTVEIIAFEINDAPQSIMNKEQRLAAIEEITKDSLVDLTNFKFNRDEANNYNE